VRLTEGGIGKSEKLEKLEKHENFQGLCRRACQPSTSKFFKGLQYGCDLSHMVSETRSTIQDLYDLTHKSPTDVKAKITYLLENHQFMCHLSKQEVSLTPILSPIRWQRTYPDRNAGRDLLPQKVQNPCTISSSGVGKCREGLIKCFLIFLTTS